jgi:hypothetical protein
MTQPPADVKGVACDSPKWARLRTPAQGSQERFIVKNHAERTAREPFGDQHGGVVGHEQAKYGPAFSGRGQLSGAPRLPDVVESIAALIPHHS